MYVYVRIYKGTVLVVGWNVILALDDDDDDLQRGLGIETKEGWLPGWLAGQCIWNAIKY